MDHSSREPSAELTASGDSDVTESSASSSISLDSASDIETDDASSGSGSDGELPTPRRAPAEEQPRERPRLALPVPRLDITGAGNEEARSRAPKLPVPALSIPVGGSDCGPGTPAFGGEPEVAIELLSPAFSVLSSSGRGVHGIQSDCATKLGVRQDRVRLFALVELNGNEAPPPGCHRVAVEVRGSAFSLQAMEDVLKENQRLSAAVAAAGPPADKSEVEMLRAEIDHLRQRLTSSELLRHRGQEALQELKEEFETLHFDLMQNPDTAMSAQTMLAQE